MTSVIRVGQSKFVTVQIDEDSNERIMNCIQTLSEVEKQPAVHEIFLTDTKAAFSRMLAAQEVYLFFLAVDERCSDTRVQKRAAEKKEAETTKAITVHVDDLLTFRQFSKKTADEAIDVRLPVCQSEHDLFSPTLSLISTMRTSAVQQDPGNCKRISSLILVEYLSLQVNYLCFLFHDRDNIVA